MASFFEYASTTFWHWWPLVSTGSLLGVEEFFQRYSERFKRLSDRVTSGHRRFIQLAALFAALFYSGFLVWNEEHEARLKAEKNSSPIQQSTFDRLSGDLTVARGKIDEQTKLIQEQQERLANLSAGVWQPLTTAQIAELSERIKAINGELKKVVVQCASPRLCGRFAASLREAFGKGEWQASLSESPTQRSGFWIYPYDDEGKALQAVLSSVLGRVEIDETWTWPANPDQGHWLAIGERTP